ncbi:MAG: efflux RND transporter periplasmic adaptor subunit [Parvibaculaceae bacterium]|nr:efflux RND transporter periplasmic adaptor subunit [Parvibaculaceae bacterium]
MTNLPHNPPRKSRRGLLIGIAVIVVGLVLWFTLHHGGRRTAFMGDEAIPVAAGEVALADVPVYAQGVGTVQAFKTVTMRAQVSGQLVKVPFVEGQEVKKGDLLALIDKATYQATYDQAVAKKAQDQALLDNAIRDLARYEELARTNYSSHQQADTQKSTVAQYRAQLQSDQAAIESAKATLDYCTIVSPIDGRTGVRLVDEGNLVSSGDTTGIVVVTETKPISVVFTLPQQQLEDVMAATRAGQVTADALGGDGTSVLDTGVLAVVDNEIDQATGTLKLKATFPNLDEKLWPGAFVNVRLRLKTLEKALVVPSAAVQQGASGPYVFVIKDDKTVTQQNVTLLQSDDTQAVLGAGVTAGQKIVTTGFAQLKEGSKISLGDEVKPAATDAP